MLASLTLSSSPADAPLTAPSLRTHRPTTRGTGCYSKAVEKARMQITLFFWPLKVLTSPLTHVLEGQGPVRHRQDVWWSVYVPCTYDEVMRNPAVATMNGIGEEISPVYGGIGRQSRHKLTVTKLACMCLRNLHWCTNSGCTQCILTHKHAHAHTHTHTHTNTHTHTHQGRSVAQG